MEFEGPKTTLFIRVAKMSDAGWYQCTATSLAGTAITKCRVTVIRKKRFALSSESHRFSRSFSALSQADQFIRENPNFGPQLLNKVPM
jgi:hypothetical protein